MKFNDWYDKTYPETIGKYDAINVACRLSAAFAWEACAKHITKEILGHIKKINCDHNLAYYCDRKITEEIEEKFLVLNEKEIS